MGHLAAADFAAHAPLSVALVWHLTANHYPALPAALAGPCERAIELARAGEWDAEVDISEAGILVRKSNGEPTSTPTVSRLVEAAHLDAFIEAHDGGAYDDEDF